MCILHLPPLQNKGVFMKQVLLAFSIFAVVAGASAQQTQPSSRTQEVFTCFNRAQLADAPIVSIVVDQKGNQFAHLMGRGLNSFIALERKFGMGLLDNSNYEGNGISVLEIAGIENPPKRAVVTFHNGGLVYNCRPTQIQY